MTLLRFVLAVIFYITAYGYCKSLFSYVTLLLLVLWLYIFFSLLMPSILLNIGIVMLPTFLVLVVF